MAAALLRTGHVIAARTGRDHTQTCSADACGPDGMKDSGRGDRRGFGLQAGSLSEHGVALVERFVVWPSVHITIWPSVSWIPVFPHCSKPSLEAMELLTGTRTA